MFCNFEISVILFFMPFIHVLIPGYALVGLGEQLLRSLSDRITAVLGSRVSFHASRVD